MTHVSRPAMPDVAQGPAFSAKAAGGIPGRIVLQS